MYIARINDNNEIQSLQEHSVGVANISSNFSVKFFKALVFNTGLYHDIGKYQKSFQEKIQGKEIAVEHSICGAQVSVKEYNECKCLAGMMMAYCIAGHHSGLPNGGFPNDDEEMSTLYGRLKRQSDDYNVYKKELVPQEVDVKKLLEFILTDCLNDKSLVMDKLAFMIRYVFSCLTDADTVDSARFCGVELESPLYTSFAACLQKINRQFDMFDCKTELQKKRSVIQQQVFDNIGKKGNIYIINMPTGSGKTLCSVKFALEKAVREGKKRIIYVIPYNSIIDQTASVFEDMFGSDMQLLRHQSTFSYMDEGKYTSAYAMKAKYNTENWQADFIITTAVQFFESLWAYKKAKLRKVHNMADSIIIFDEIHKLPMQCLKPCLQAVACLTKYLNSEAVFMTATMPDFRSLMKKYTFDNVSLIDLVTNKDDFSAFRKCRYTYMPLQGIEDIIQHSLQFPSTLVVVNKKRVARDFYQLYTGEKYHLSTYMTARDRKSTIAKIKNRLQQLSHDYPDMLNVPPERRIHVVSTSLIEAGVDLDFYTAYRELNNLDSILQTGGRCNREGNRKYGEVFVFETMETRSQISRIESSITRGILKEFADIDSEECVSEYYRRLYEYYDANISKMGLSGENASLDALSIPFRDIDLHMIDSPTISLIVPQDDICARQVETLRCTGIAKFRLLQQYACNVYAYELKNLVEQGVAKNYNGIDCLIDMKYYDENIGVLFEGGDYIIDGGVIL